MNERKLNTRFFSSQQEKQIAKVVGGRTTPNSGATKYQKGDVSTTRIYTDANGETKEREDFLFEAKTCMTPKQSFSIKKKWLEGIREEAFQAGKTNYALVFNFGPNEENYYILSEKKFKELFPED